MDTTVLTAIQSVLTNALTYFLQNNPSPLYNSSAAIQYIGPAQFLGYGGATIAVFLTAAGIYQMSAEVIKDVNEGMDNFLREYTSKATDDSSVYALLQSEYWPTYENILLYYSWQILLMLSAIFLHELFLLVTSLAVGWTILWKIKDLDAIANGSTVDITSGWKLALLGTLFGSIAYLAATALEFNDNSLLKFMLETQNRVQVQKT